MNTDLFGIEHATRRDMASHQIPAGGSAKSTDEWLTPPDLIAAIGPFDLDPCSPGARRPWDTAAKHYGIEDDGLRQPWEGRVWLNPPYCDMRRWLTRLADHEHGTALIFARTETALWFDLVWGRATGVLFMRGRVSFHYVNGKRAKANSGAPSALVAYGNADAEVLASEPWPGHYVAVARGGRVNRHHVESASGCSVGPAVQSQWRNGPHWHVVWPDGDSWCYETETHAAERLAELEAVAEASC